MEGEGGSEKEREREREKEGEREGEREKERERGRESQREREDWVASDGIFNTEACGGLQRRPLPEEFQSVNAGSKNGRKLEFRFGLSYAHANLSFWVHSFLIPFLPTAS